MQPSSKMLGSSSPEGAMLCLSSLHKKCQTAPPLDKCCKAAPLKKYHKAATTKCFTEAPLEISLQALPEIETITDYKHYLIIK